MKCSKPQAVGKSVCRRVPLHVHMRVCVYEVCVGGVRAPVGVSSRVHPS